MTVFLMYKLVYKWLWHLATQIWGNTAEASLFVAEAMEEIGEYFE